MSFAMRLAGVSLTAAALIASVTPANAVELANETGTSVSAAAVEGNSGIQFLGSSCGAAAAPSPDGRALTLTFGNLTADRGTVSCQISMRLTGGGATAIMRGGGQANNDGRFSLGLNGQRQNFTSSSDAQLQTRVSSGYVSVSVNATASGDAMAWIDSLDLEMGY